MAVKKNTDQFGRSLLTEHDVCQMLYVNPDLDYSEVKLPDPTTYNNAVRSQYSEFPVLQQLESITSSPEEWHQQNQNTWLMPDEYKDLDIARWILEQCDGEVELQRAGEELLLYAERNLLDMLSYLKYLVDTMRMNKIVWGVGRGSSIASFVLFKIGVHRINSITYQLNINEFIRE